MEKTLTIIFSLLLSSFALTINNPMEDADWRAFKLKFGGKVYENDLEERTRYNNWLNNLNEAERHNAEDKSYKRGMNQFFDLSHKEFQEIHGGCYKVPQHVLQGNDSVHGVHYLPPSNVIAPDAVNWVTEGYVTNIKNQGQCGSCYAFSTTGALEGQTFRKTGKLLELSEQNIVDCSQKYGNQGCNGGWMEYGFSYIRDNKGIDSENGYPYYARTLGYCYYNNLYNIASDTGYVDLPSGDENALKTAVASIGPISVAIDATHASFMSYRSGVYDEPACGNTLANLDHAVLVVGYGTENGQDYWLVKNSWGTYWGESGYIKMSRNKNNQCGIATRPSYPLV